MTALIQDVVFTLRVLRKRLGMTLLVIVALALGIGLNTAIFSVLNAVLLRPLHIYEPDRVVRMYAKVNRTGATMGISYPEYLDWKSQSRSFEDLAVMRVFSFTMTGRGSPEHVKGTGISSSGFKAWGVTPALGRGFTDEDDLAKSNRVVVLNFGFWQKKFGGDNAVLGKPLVLDGQEYTIVGVLQPTQIGVLQYPDVWVANGPLLDQQVMDRDNRLFFPVARLRPNVSQAQAQSEMETVASRFAVEYPESNKDIGVRFVSEVELLTSDGRNPLALLIIASTLIFLLATVNVITVFMGNTVERRQELSVRLALGAGRSRLVQQLFVQALIFAVLGGSAGLLLAKLVLAIFLTRFPAAFLRFQETTIDSRVVLVTLGMTLVTTLTATLAAAIFVSRLKVVREIQGDLGWFGVGKSQRVGQGALILFEVSLASALSLASGLLIKSLYEVEKVDLGFNPNRVFSFQISPPAERYKEPQQQSALYKLALDRLVHLPGLESTSAISGLPLTSQGEVNNLEVGGPSPLEGQRLLVEDESVLPGFFQTMRLPLVEGRDFTEADHEGTPPVVIVDDVLASKLWPGQDPLGKRVRMTGLRDKNARWLEVVGVVREIKHFGGPEAKVKWMQVYVPQYQDPTPALSFVVNTSLPAAGVKSVAEKALHDLDQDLPVEGFQTMDAYLETFLDARKVSLLLLSGFAGTGVALGMFGVFGVVASSVVRRRREIAIRMALGATVRRTMLLVGRLGLLATLGGILVGSAVIIGLTRVLSAFLFGISVFYPVVYVLSATVIVALALLASLIPALRLLRFNIQEILRQ
jgi:putative ABC transport system permease protein